MPGVPNGFALPDGDNRPHAAKSMARHPAIPPGVFQADARTQRSGVFRPIPEGGAADKIALIAWVLIC